MDNAKLCECGCGRPTTVRYGKASYFISGHNRGRLGSGAGITVECARCGAVVPRQPSEVSKTSFCSAACRDEYRREHRGSEHPSYRRVRVACLTCGQPFDTQPARAAIPYCSRACGAEGRRRKAAGRTTKPDAMHRGKALAAQARDGGGCRICGFRIALNVHHIRPKAKGGSNQLDNLIALCPNHHAMAHLGLLDADALTAAIARPPMLVPGAMVGGPR